MPFTVRFGVDCEQRVLAAGQWLTIGRSWNRANAESRACTLHGHKSHLSTRATTRESWSSSRRPRSVSFALADRVLSCHLVDPAKIGAATDRPLLAIHGEPVHAIAMSAGQALERTSPSKYFLIAVNWLAPSRPASASTTSALPLPR